ncbi:MAG: hypothetical protein ACOCUL_04345 [Bacteroidota bacterium]
MKDKTKCPVCSNTEFEAVNETPVNSNYELIFIRCASCKIAIGVLDYYNVGALVKKLAARLDIDLNK